MPALILPQVNSGITTDELGDIVAKGFKDIEWLTSGFIDSKNVRNIAGFNVSSTQLKHISGLVGMSGADPANANAIRFWSGNANPAIASFRVTQGGILTAVGMVLQSGASGERVVMDATGLHTYDSSGVERITIGTTPAKGAKALMMYGAAGPGGDQSAMVYDTETVDGASRTGQYFVGPNAQYILFSDDGDIRIQNDQLSGFRAVSNGRPEINSGGAGWNTIAFKSEVDAKQNAFTGVNGTIYVSSTSGGPTTTAITFSNGVRTS